MQISEPSRFQLKWWPMLLTSSTLAVTYFIWLGHRVSATVLIRDNRSWPRPFPYPDFILQELLRYFDTNYPAPPGTIKIHGELPRLQYIIAFACCALMLIWLLAAVSMIYRSIRISGPSRRRVAWLVGLSLICLSIMMFWPASLRGGFWSHMALGGGLALAIWAHSAIADAREASLTFAATRG